MVALALFIEQLSWYVEKCSEHKMLCKTSDGQCNVSAVLKGPNILKSNMDPISIQKVNQTFWLVPCLYRISPITNLRLGIYFFSHRYHLHGVENVLVPVCC